VIKSWLMDGIEIEELVCLPEKVVLWDVVFKRKFIKQRILRCRKLTHHEENTSPANDERSISYNRVFQLNHLEAGVKIQ